MLGTSQIGINNIKLHSEGSMAVSYIKYVLGMEDYYGTDDAYAAITL